MTSCKGQPLCYLTLALLSLIGCHCKETAEEFQAALGKPSRLYGPVKKEGYLPLRRCAKRLVGSCNLSQGFASVQACPIESQDVIGNACSWDNATWDHTPFWQWALNEIAYAVGDSSQQGSAVSAEKLRAGPASNPPPAAPCDVWIAPHQKVLLITHRAPASTVLLQALGLCSGPQRAPTQACFRKANQGDVRAAGGEKAFWQSHWCACMLPPTRLCMHTEVPACVLLLNGPRMLLTLMLLTHGTLQLEVQG